MGRRLIITEEEKKYIRRLYNIYEDSPSSNTDTTATTPSDTGTTPYTISKKIIFPAGYYNESYLIDETNNINDELNKVKQYISENKDSIISIKIALSSSESRIPNYDNEDGKKEVGVGYLANKRYNTIRTYMNKILEEWKTSNFINDYTIELTEPKLGTTIWVGQEFCPVDKIQSTDEEGRACLKKDFNPGNNIKNWYDGKNSDYKDILSQYTSEQNVTLNIQVLVEDKKIEDCLEGMTIEVYYNKDGKHICNSSTYEIFINGIQLNRDDGESFASLNNRVKQDDLKKGKTYDKKDIEYYDNSVKSSGVADYGGSRNNLFEISDELAQTLLGGGQKTFDITAKCINPTNQKQYGGGCHTDVGYIKITNGRQIKSGSDVGITYQIKTPNERDQVVSLIKIDACGNKVTT